MLCIATTTVVERDKQMKGEKPAGDNFAIAHFRLRYPIAFSFFRFFFHVLTVIKFLTLLWLYLAESFSFVVLYQPGGV